MATTTSLTTSYAGAVAGDYLIRAFMANESMQHVTVRTDIAHKMVVKKLVDEVTFAALNCDFTPTGTVTITERSITPEWFEVARQLCKKDFLADWEVASMGPLRDKLPPTMERYFVEVLTNGIAEKLESVMWTGVNANAGEFDGLITLIDADATVNFVASPVAITSSNVQAKLALLIAEMPLAVKASTEKPLIYMSNDVWEAYMFSQVSTGNGWYATGGPEVPKTYLGLYQIVVAPGMPANTMIMAQKSNLWFGTNAVSALNTIDVLDMYEHDLSENVRFKARFSAAVQYGIGSEIAAYGPGLS